MKKLLAVWVLGCALGWPSAGLADETPVKEATPSATTEKDKEEKEYYELLRLFADTLDQVDRNYVKDVSKRELMEAAIRGMMGKLDQHSNYIPPEDMERFKIDVESEFGGVGIQVSTEGGQLRVISPIYGTPAYKAGILAGDTIVKIEDKATRGMNIDDCIKQLKDKGLKGLIVDLRFNPGGLLTSAIEVSDLFVAEGDIVSTEGRNTPKRSWTARKPGTYEGFPMVVLVNRYSASASEIVSACLQDHNRAVVMGERTWGKGSVQNIIQLEGGKSAMKLTTAGYKRPSGKNIHRFEGASDTDEWGVKPNDGYDMRLSDTELAEVVTARRERDILKKLSEGETPPELKDRQLTKALEYINGKIDEAAKAEVKEEKGEEGKS
jgi:C-terminal processing protease CtpA/Prc